MKRKKSILKGLVLFCILMEGIVGCGSNKADNVGKIEKETTILNETDSSQNKKQETSYSKKNEKAESKETVYGNSNANIVNGGEIAEKDGWLYYGMFDGLYKCKEDGSEKEKILDINGGVYNINILDDEIYYGGRGVYRIKTDGTDNEQIASDDVTGAMHIIDNTMYIGNEYKMNLDGSNLEQIYYRNQPYGYTLNVDNGWIYFYDTDSAGEEGIFRMKYDGSDLEKIFDGRADYMIVDSDWIYFQNQKDHKYLYKMKLDGTDVQLIIDSSVQDMYVNDNWIYYNCESQDLYKVRTDGTDNQLIYEGCARDLHILGDWIYFRVSPDTSLYRMKLDGTESQIFADIQD